MLLGRVIVFVKLLQHTGLIISHSVTTLHPGDAIRVQFGLVVGFWVWLSRVWVELGWLSRFWVATVLAHKDRKLF